MIMKDKEPSHETQIDTNATDNRSTNSITEERNIPPDGGYGWVCAICLHFIIFSTWGANSSFGVFLSFYMKSDYFKHTTSYDYALIGGLVVFLAQLLAPILILLSYIFGIHQVLYTGVILQAISYVLASFAVSIWQLYLTQGVLVGVSFALVFSPATLVLPSWFVHRRASAMGIAVSGAGTGGLFYSLTINKIISVAGGHEWALRYLGLTNLVLGLVACTLIRPREYSPPKLSTTLQRSFITDKCKSVFNFDLFKNYPVLLVSFWFLLLMMGYILILFLISAYAVLINLSLYQGSILTAILNAGQCIGRPLMGLFADRIGRCNFTLVVTSLIATLVWAFWINAHSFILLAIFCVLIGFFIGIGNLMSQPFTSDIVSETPEKLPAAWSLVNIIVLFFCLPAEVIALAVRDQDSKTPFLNTQIFAGFCYLGSILLLLAIRERLVSIAFHKKMNDESSGTIISDNDTNYQREERLRETSLTGIMLRIICPIRV